MKKFRFRLEIVERHKKLLEQEKQVWLSKCLEKLRATERRLLQVDTAEVQARREFASLGANANGQKINSGRFWVLDQFIAGQKIRREMLKQQLEIDEQEVNMAYQQFLKARQQRKIMEKLHEKKLSAHGEEIFKMENRQQDELYVMRDRLRVIEDQEGGNHDD